MLNPKNTLYTVQAGEVKSLTDQIPQYPPLNTADYDLRMIALANNPIIQISTTTKTATGTVKIIISTTTPNSPWPVHTAYPDNGAILPFKRIIAYYGNFYSTSMGVLGQYPEEEVITKLTNVVNAWTVADPNTPAIPAIDYIAVTAQGYSGTDNLYRLRMPDDQIEKAISMANKVNGITILDIQPGQSTFEKEIPPLEKYLQMPNVNLGLDPEFAMQPGQVPGKIYIGTIDASDINFAIDYLSNIVDTYHLPPKILIVHRFTEDMVTNYQKIKTVPEVQVVINMDGWGTPASKLFTYSNYVSDEPVEFTGFKLFYKNDTTNGNTLMTPDDLLKLNPRPIYIQYQ